MQPYAIPFAQLLAKRDYYSYREKQLTFPSRWKEERKKK